MGGHHGFSLNERQQMRLAPPLVLPLFGRLEEKLELD